MVHKLYVILYICIYIMYIMRVLLVFSSMPHGVNKLEVAHIAGNNLFHRLAVLCGGTFVSEGLFFVDCGEFWFSLAGKTGLGTWVGNVSMELASICIHLQMACGNNWFSRLCFWFCPLFFLCLG